MQGVVRDLSQGRGDLSPRHATGTERTQGGE
jgi:hypothetical protein